MVYLIIKYSLEPAQHLVLRVLYKFGSNPTMFPAFLSVPSCESHAYPPSLAAGYWMYVTVQTCANSLIGFSRSDQILKQNESN